MRKCGICNLYVENEAKFCPYCGKRIYTAVSIEFEDEEVKLKSEEYKYNGEIRERYQVVGENGKRYFPLYRILWCMSLPMDGYTGTSCG